MRKKIFYTGYGGMKSNLIDNTVKDDDAGDQGGTAGMAADSIKTS